MFRSEHVSDPLHIVRGFHANTERLLPRDTTESSAKREVQARHRNWLQTIVGESGDTLFQVAHRSGVSASTLTRLANNLKYGGVLSAVTIERISRAYQVPGPDEYGASRRPALIGLSEAERYLPADEQDDICELVKHLLGRRGGLDAWRLKTDALEQVGYLAGDVVVVDMHAAAQPQDVVCAQVHNWRGGGSQTIWRVYDPPYLVGAAHDRTAYKPVMVDSERVVIKGVVDKLVRPFRRSDFR